MSTMTQETVNTDAYNGWTNRETWAVALHINNDQGWQESVYEALRNAPADDCTCPRAETLQSHDPGCPVPAGSITAATAGDIIQSNVDDTLDMLAESGNYEAYQLIRNDIGSLWRVNWTELGASFLSDVEASDPDAAASPGDISEA